MSTGGHRYPLTKVLWGSYGFRFVWGQDVNWGTSDLCVLQPGDIDVQSLGRL